MHYALITFDTLGDRGVQLMRENIIIIITLR